jgi:hypothetical protein
MGGEVRMIFFDGKNKFKRRGRDADIAYQNFDLGENP